MRRESQDRERSRAAPIAWLVLAAVATVPLFVIGFGVVPSEPDAPETPPVEARPTSAPARERATPPPGCLPPPSNGAELAAITGKVVDVGAGPIAGAQISARGRWATRSEDDGSFRLEVPEGTYRLAVQAVGYAAPTNTTVSAPGKITLSLFPEAVIEARVVRGATDEGVSDAHVVMTGPALRVGRTDAAGAVRFGGLRPGAYTIEARGKGWAVRRGREIDVDVAETKRVVLSASPAFAVHARVRLEETGAPCTHAYVVLNGAVGFVEQRGSEDGRVEIEGVLPGRYAPQVSCAQMGAAVLAEIQVDRDLHDLEWTIPKGVQIRGRVLDRRGRPVQRTMVMSEPLGEDGAVEGTSAHSDEDGRFVLRGLTPGDHSLTAMIDTDFTSTTVSITGADLHGVLIRPAPRSLFSAVLSGVVVFEDGRPASSVPLAVRDAVDLRRGFIRTVTSHDGSFRVNVDAPEVHVSIGPQTTTDVAFVPPSMIFHTVVLQRGRTARVRYVVASMDRSIRGRVVDEAGYGIDGVTVVAVPERDKEVFDGVTEGYIRPKSTAVTAANGRFELDGLAPGPYAVRAWRGGGHQAVAREVVAPAEIELRIAPPGAIAGFVSGLSVAPAFVVRVADARQEFSRLGRFEAGDGTFDFPGLPAGSYRVTVRAKGLGGDAEAIVRPGATEQVRVDLVPSSVVEGRVLDVASRRGVADCHVVLEGEPELVFLTTDREGRFAARDVGVGPRRIEVSCLPACSKTIDLFVERARHTLPAIVCSPFD